MFPRSQRYPLRLDRTFFDDARKKSFPGILFYVKEQPELKTTSQAVVIIKKTLGKAVARNILKRQVQAALSPLLSQYPGKSVVCLPLRQEIDVHKLRTFAQEVLST